MTFLSHSAHIPGFFLKSRTFGNDLFFISFLIAAFKGFHGINGATLPAFIFNPLYSSNVNHLVQNQHYESQRIPFTNSKIHPSLLTNRQLSETNYPSFHLKKPDQPHQSVYELDKRQNGWPSYLTLKANNAKRKFSSWLSYQNSFTRKNNNPYEELLLIPKNRISLTKREYNLMKFFPTLKIKISENIPAETVAENVQRSSQSELTLKSLNQKKDLNEILGHPSVEWACGPYASGEIRKILFSEITKEDVHYIKRVAHGDEGNFMNVIDVCCQRKDPFGCEGNAELKRILIAGLFLHFNFGEDS